MSFHNSQIALLVADELRQFAENISEAKPVVCYTVSAKMKEYGSRVEIDLKRKKNSQEGERTFALLTVKVRSAEDFTGLQKILQTLTDLCFTVLQSNTKD